MMNALEEAYEAYFGEDMEARSPWVYGEDEGQMPSEELLSRMELIRVKKNTILYTQNERSPKVFVVKSGVVRTVVSRATGEETHLLIAGPGSLLGTQVCVDGYPNCVTAVTVEDCQLYAVSSARFSQWIAEDTELKDLIIRDFSRKLRALAAKLESLAFDAADVRMMQSMVFLIEKFGCPADRSGKMKIDLIFTHHEMADLIHSNRVTVSRFFSKLIKEDVIEKRGRYYYVKKPSYFGKYFRDGRD